MSMAIFVAAVGGVRRVGGGDRHSHAPNSELPDGPGGPAGAGLSQHPGPGGWGVLASLGGLTVGFSLLFVPWLLGGSGMGDVKLLAALGAWLGWKFLLAAFAVSTVFAAFAALAMMAFSVIRPSAAHQAHRRPSLLQTRRRRHTRVIPFAVPVAMSTWSVLIYMVTRGVL